MMERLVLRFWGAAAATAAAVAAAAYLFMPYGALGAVSEVDRHRVWLLTLWTGGVFAVLFGFSALLGAFRGLGFREVYEAGGSVQKAAERYRESLRWGGEPFHASFAWWLIVTGVMLVAIYFMAWAAGRG